MRRPTAEEIKAARNRVRSKGHVSPDVQWLSVLAITDRECAECTNQIADAATELLHVPQQLRDRVRGIINGAFIAGLHIGLEL